MAKSLYIHINHFLENKRGLKNLAFLKPGKAYFGTFDSIIQIKQSITSLCFGIS